MIPKPRIGKLIKSICKDVVLKRDLTSIVYDSCIWEGSKNETLLISELETFECEGLLDLLTKNYFIICDIGDDYYYDSYTFYRFIVDELKTSITLIKQYLFVLTVNLLPWTHIDEKSSCFQTMTSLYSTQSNSYILSQNSITPNVSLNQGSNFVEYLINGKYESDELKFFKITNKLNKRLFNNNILREVLCKRKNQIVNKKHLNLKSVCIILFN